LANLPGDVVVKFSVQPFELNPQMPVGGQDITEHLTQKYGSTAEQQAQIRDTIRQRGAELGFAFNASGRGRIYNTFAAHRLLHWAGLESADKQLALKKALLVACHSDSQAMDSTAILLAAVAQAGLDVARAQNILASDEFTAEVREAQAFYASQGIRSVPAVIINDQHLISGGQPVGVFEQALRQIAAMQSQAQ
uniref:DsbA family oxidoreductase n=1 Tax=Rhodoferax sp. TaxID=50421 RepID=UPI0025F0577F